MKAASLTRDLETRDAELAAVRATNGSLEASLTRPVPMGRPASRPSMPSKRPMPTFESLLALRRPPPADGDVTAITAERDALRASLDAAEQALAALPGRDDAVETRTRICAAGSRRSPTPWSNRRACPGPKPSPPPNRSRNGSDTGPEQAPAWANHRTARENLRGRHVSTTRRHHRSPARS